MPKVSGNQGAAVVKACDELLSEALVAPAALQLEGEPGIGKTTLWNAAIELARTRGFRVMSACPSEAESVLAYGAVADLLRDVDSDTTVAALPGPQQKALNRVLLQDDSEQPATDAAVAAGLLSVITGLAADCPLLIAIDDVQWLDPSSANAIAFAARRLPPRVALLTAIRTGAPTGGLAPVQLPNPTAMHRFRVAPMTLGALHSLINERLDISLSRPKMVHLHSVSAGNPFYALELARAIRDAGPGVTSQQLPATLGDLVRARVATLGQDARQVLLAVACAAAPTLHQVAVAADSDADAAAHCLEAAESAGIVAFDGERVRFTHPLLAHGVYNDAPRAQRRRCHQRLAGVVTHPELKARHLALAAVRSDPNTLAALDDAAHLAGLRGAPAAAAELVELAINLGGDTSPRRILLAECYFQAGDVELARNAVSAAIDTLESGALRARAHAVLAATHLYRGSHAEAEASLYSAVDEAGPDLEIRVRALTMLALAQLNIGKPDAARRHIDAAVSDAERLGQPQLLSQALGIRALAVFTSGDGYDVEGLQRAIALEDPDASMPVAFRPSMQYAFLLACIGELDEARTKTAEVKRQCLDRGDETEYMFAILYSALIEIWRGEFDEASVYAAEATERATQLGGDIAVVTANTIAAMLATYAGRVDEARAATAAALAAGSRTGSSTLSAFAMANLGFLEVSTGEFGAAATTLEPMIAILATAPNCSEILPAAFVPDAVEALLTVGRHSDAEPLVGMLERNGTRLDRPWMLAIGARCRALLHADNRDVDAAHAAAELAMAHHERLPMPFERARTQLLLGQLQRRLRRKDAAAATLTDALRTFERLGVPLWAQRAKAELSRVNSTHDRGAVLTPAEQRVAELAASGMTNRDVAAAMFISPKTVEVNLSRIYRKLGIRSRAELGAIMTHLEG